MSAVAPAAEGFLEGYAQHVRTLAQDSPDWLRARRVAGLTRFEQLGLPTPKDEAWRQTNLAALTRERFEIASLRGDATADPDLPQWTRLPLDGPRLVFHDGRHRPGSGASVELPRGVLLCSLAEALARFPERIERLLAGADDGATAFEALNSALVEDGAAVIVPDGLQLPQPIQLCYTAGGAPRATASHPLTLVLAGAGSSLRLVEQYVGPADGGYFTNARTRVHVEDNASVEHYRLQLESPTAFHIASTLSVQGRDSRYTAHNISLGGRMVRQDIRAVLDGEGATCLLYGLYMTRNSQHVDNHTLLDHAQPHCHSHELYKGILDDRSRSVFSGRIVVREGAQKTDAIQSNPNLLLSPTALAHTRPQLEIYADDVKCTHGATVGQIDEEGVFYLRSRGIPEAEARSLLVHAFAGEVLERIDLEPLRITLEQAVHDRLAESIG